VFLVELVFLVERSLRGVERFHVVLDFAEVELQAIIKVIQVRAVF
jgi:hypothetical protein